MVLPHLALLPRLDLLSFEENSHLCATRGMPLTATLPASAPNSPDACRLPSTLWRCWQPHQKPLSTSSKLGSRGGGGHVQGKA